MTTRRSVVAKAADAAVKLADTNGAVPEVSQPAKDDVQGDMLEPSVVNKGGVSCLPACLPGMPAACLQQFLWRLRASTDPR
jgi:hypothetical protein